MRHLVAKFWSKSLTYLFFWLQKWMWWEKIIPCTNTRCSQVERHFVNKPKLYPLDWVKYHCSKCILSLRWNAWLCQCCSTSETWKSEGQAEEIAHPWWSENLQGKNCCYICISSLTKNQVLLMLKNLFQKPKYINKHNKCCPPLHCFTANSHRLEISDEVLHNVVP